MSLKQNLQNLIDREISIKELYFKARAERFYKSSCIERRCRELTNAGKIIPLKKKGYIYAYKPNMVDRTELEPKHSTGSKFAQIKPNNKIANEQLRAILLNLKNLTWNDPRVAELQKAIKSKYLETKLAIIKKYEPLQNL
jgi:hypothetical protein